MVLRDNQLKGAIMDLIANTDPLLLPFYITAAIIITNKAYRFMFPRGPLGRRAGK